MAVSLSKGGNVSLSKEAPGLSEIVVGLGWERVTEAPSSTSTPRFVTGENGKVLNDASFIFYNNKKSADGSIEHLATNRSAGDGDDEQVNVKLTGLAADVKSGLRRHDSRRRARKRFGQVSNAYIRVVNKADSKNCPPDLSEDASTEKPP